LKTIFVVSVIALALSFSQAYGAFDSAGNYYCNPNNLPLEKTIYEASISKVNANLQEYRSLNPDASIQDLHNYLANGNDGTSDSYYIMNQAKACLDSNGINPISVVAPSPYLLQIFSAPEFGIVSALVLGVTLATVVVFQNKINSTGLVKKF
jgi:hypothetical protein